MLRQVLLAFDSTPSSEAALALGFEVARALGAALQVVTVVGASGPIKAPEPAADRRAAWQSLRGLEREAVRVGISLQLDVLVGDASEEILKRATDLPADILVLGRPQPTGVERLAIGSVADRVLAEAPCAVLLPKAAKPTV